MRQPARQRGRVMASEGEGPHRPVMSGRLVGGRDLDEMLKESSIMGTKMEGEAWAQSKGLGMLDEVQSADKRRWQDWNEAEDARFPRKGLLKAEGEQHDGSAAGEPEEGQKGEEQHDEEVSA